MIVFFPQIHYTLYFVDSDFTGITPTKQTRTVKFAQYYSGWFQLLATITSPHSLVVSVVVFNLTNHSDWAWSCCLYS